jgi:GTP cyclohydrolase I
LARSKGPSEIEGLVRELLIALGEDPERDGLKETPRRMARLYQELTQGYRLDPWQIIGGAIFPVDYDSMVIMKDIEFYSLCEHHLVPYFGHVHVGYIPKGKVIGASKIPRIVDFFARRLQLQERMTEEIARFLEEAIQPLGLGVVVEGFHLCMAMRGVAKQDAWIVTSAMKGSFKRDARTRSEFLQFIAQSPGFRS